jgi:hypothetical protein
VKTICERSTTRLFVSDRNEISFCVLTHGLEFLSGYSFTSFTLCVLANSLAGFNNFVVPPPPARVPSAVRPHSESQSSSASRPQSRVMPGNGHAGSSDGRSPDTVRRSRHMTRTQSNATSTTTSGTQRAQRRPRRTIFPGESIQSREERYQKRLRNGLGEEERRDSRRAKEEGRANLLRLEAQGSSPSAIKVSRAYDRSEELTSDEIEGGWNPQGNPRHGFETASGASS